MPSTRSISLVIMVSTFRAPATSAREPNQKKDPYHAGSLGIDEGVLASKRAMTEPPPHGTR